MKCIVNVEMWSSTVLATLTHGVRGFICKFFLLKIHLNAEHFKSKNNEMHTWFTCVFSAAFQATANWVNECQWNAKKKMLFLWSFFLILDVILNMQNDVILKAEAKTKSVLPVLQDYLLRAECNKFELPVIATFLIWKLPFWNNIVD